ncbi:MAG: CDP-glycerol glycerophosphotransferase family protein [Eubacteriales bacterium]|nr:CDP-glycerol glycerophosphotransferase family protein [Eubacteriales bacterium]
MFDSKMIINKMIVDKNKLNISASISCPFDVDVTSPKAKIVFECDGRVRRLPFLVTNYFRQKQSSSCIIVCTYTFLLDSIFYNFESDSDITARIDFYYGDNTVESVPFTVSTNVLNENPDIRLDEQYIEYECFDGVTVFTNEENDFESDRKKNGHIYTVSFDCENSRIVISKSKELHRGGSLAERSRIIIPALRFVFFILRIILSVLLAPYFVLDGIFAGLGVLPKRKTKEIDGLLRNIFVQIKINFSSFLKTSFKKSVFRENIRKPLFAICKIYYKILSKKDIVPNRVTFMSGRRDEIGGNPLFVYNLLKDRDDIDFRFLMFSDPAGHSRIKNIVKFLRLYATSRVVIVDDYFRLLNLVDKREGVKLFQLWHACGAFKTFGFTRLGKKGGPKQTDPNHRMYDYAIVSSQEIAKHYAEGFGLSDENVVATGIPRTDIFMDKEYADNIRNGFYERYPQLENKKIMLFAPTFRGNGQMSAFYPTSAFSPVEVYEQLKGEYAIIIKLHPFCQERFEIPEEYKDVIIDLSDDDELNDLLFVTDLLVTDYSSVVFEASLLNIPMMFYAFDLYDYISSRDFYYDFEGFVPGKIVFSQRELVECIEEKDFEAQRVEGFKNKFFDHLDGKSSQRVADLILKNLDK